MTALATAQGLFQRFVAAAPVAWRQDRLFQGAVIGVGVTLAVLLVRPDASRQETQLPPLGTPTVGLPAVLSPAGSGTTPLPQTPPAEVPKIAPGHALDDVTVVPTPDGDRFGTFKPGRQP